MNFGQLSFIIFVDGLNLFGLFMLSKADESLNSLFYFGCGIVFAITFTLTLIVISELSKMMKKEEIM